mgnify:CR=1 FL=1
MNQKTYFLVCGAVFLVVAAAHLTRLIVGWKISIAGWAVPYGVSIPGLIITGVLSVVGFVLVTLAKATV